MSRFGRRVASACSWTVAVSHLVMTMTCIVAARPLAPLPPEPAEPDDPLIVPA